MFYHLFNVPLCIAGFLWWILCASWELYSLALLLYMGPVVFQVFAGLVFAARTVLICGAAQPWEQPRTGLALLLPTTESKRNPRTQQEGASSSGHRCRQGQRGFSCSFFKAVVLIIGQRVSWEDCGLHLRKMIKCCRGFLKICWHPTPDTSKDHN